GRDLPGDLHDPDVLRRRQRKAEMEVMEKLLAACLMLALAACSLQPVYERPAAPVASEFPAGPAYKDSPAGGSPAVDIGWRDFLADPRLQRLVEIALKNNRDLRVAMLNVAEVQAQYRIQRAALLPQVDGFADASRTRNKGVTSNDYSVGVAAAWEIDFFGRLRSLSDAAFEQYFATAYARQAAEILLVSQVADQYLAMLALNEQLAVTRRTLETAQASYKIVKLQFDTGTAAELTLRQSETVVEQANANNAALVRARAQAENGLVLLIGQALPADLPPALPMGEEKILADIPAGLPSDQVARRPDILQAEALLRSENANIGAARAAPMLAFSERRSASACRMSGRRATWSDGSPAGMSARIFSSPIGRAGGRSAGSAWPINSTSPFSACARARTSAALLALACSTTVSDWRSVSSAAVPVSNCSFTILYEACAVSSVRRVTASCSFSASMARY